MSPQYFVCLVTCMLVAYMLNVLSHAMREIQESLTSSEVGLCLFTLKNTPLQDGMNFKLFIKQQNFRLVQTESIFRTNQIHRSVQYYSKSL